MPAAKCSSTESARFLTCCRYLLPTCKRRREFHQYNLGDKNPCTRRFLHNSHGLIISVRPSSDITRPHAGKAQACQQESNISQQPCRAADGPAPANRNAVCLQNARPSIGMTYVLLLSSALHCFFISKFLFIACCTVFSIHACLFTRGAILLGIESAPLSEDEVEDSSLLSTDTVVSARCRGVR